MICKIYEIANQNESSPMGLTLWDEIAFDFFRGVGYLNYDQLTEEYIVNRVQEVIDRKPKWDSRVKHLVIPFFIRSQIIYSWDMYLYLIINKNQFYHYILTKEQIIINYSIIVW